MDDLHGRLQLLLPSNMGNLAICLVHYLFGTTCPFEQETWASQTPARYSENRITSLEAPPILAHVLAKDKVMIPWMDSSSLSLPL